MTAAGALVSQSRAVGRAMAAMRGLCAQRSAKQQRDPRGSEQFAVGGPLERSEKHVRTCDVDCGCQDRDGSRGVVAREQIHCDSGAEQCDGCEDDGRCGEWHRQREQRAEDPRQWRIEQEARLACIPCCRNRPRGIERAVTHLRGGIEPALQVKLEVVSAGAAVRDERRNDDKREQRKQDRRPCSRKGRRRTMHGVQLN